MSFDSGGDELQARGVVDEAAQDGAWLERLVGLWRGSAFLGHRRVSALVEFGEPFGAVLVLEDGLLATAVGVGDRVDGVLDHIAALCTVSPALVCSGATAPALTEGAG